MINKSAINIQCTHPLCRIPPRVIVYPQFEFPQRWRTHISLRQPMAFLNISEHEKVQC